MKCPKCSHEWKPGRRTHLKRDQYHAYCGISLMKPTKVLSTEDPRSFDCVVCEKLYEKKCHPERPEAVNA